MCPYCTTLKEFLKERGVEFEEIDVSQDEKAMKEMVEKTGQMGVPVMEIDGEIVVGFDREKIIRILKLED
jgi:glutaredoxin-like YruB-family protein